MLKTRIIPILLWDGVQAVQTVQFGQHRPVGSMMHHIETLEKRGIDELIILYIHKERYGLNYFQIYDKISEFASKMYCPLTIGGGISDLDNIKNLLNCGADKVAIGYHSDIIPSACKKFGKQSIIQIINIRIGNYWSDLIYDPGEVLVTSIENQGTQKGYYYPHIILAKHLWKCPIIINGGCGTPQHMLEAIRAGADAVAASSMFLFTETTPKDCAKYLNEHGVPTRLT